jgi:hypothetical protein
MTELVYPISTATHCIPAVLIRCFQQKQLLFRFFGQSPALALEGLDALYLLTVNNPDAIELMGSDCTIT